jgi:hypothetical protein
MLSDEFTGRRFFLESNAPLSYRLRLFGRFIAKTKLKSINFIFEE